MLSSSLREEGSRYAKKTALGQNGSIIGRGWMHSLLDNRAAQL
jgi:hypothetical protein